MKCEHLCVLVVMHLMSIWTVSSAQNPIAQAVKTNTSNLLCRELFSATLSIECFFGGNMTSCDEPMLNGTTATLKCRHSYYLDVMPFEEVHCRNGQWNRPLFNCEPMCGTKTSKATPYVVRGQDADIGDFPWHTSIYLYYEQDLSYICGGSILSPKLVVTAAHCFLDPNPRLYRVAAGKVHREWHHERDKDAQYREVGNILTEKNYRGELTGYAADIAIMVLDQVFILTDFIRPICLDYLSTSFDFPENKLADVAGWGLTAEDGDLSDILQYTSLPLIDNDECLKIVPDEFTSQVTLDKICAGYTIGISVCTGDSGGGLVSARRFNSTVMQYYLIGIVSTGPYKEVNEEELCDSFKYSTFTTVATYIKWINETKFIYENWSPYDYGCSLPDLPTYGQYIVEADIPEGRELLPGSLVPHYAKLKYSCDPGYGLQGSDTVTCKERAWNVNNNYLPACFKTCLTLNSTELDIEYSFTNSDHQVILHETQAIFRCDDSNYELEQPAYNQTTCRDGNWTRSLLKCIPLCGISSFPTKLENNGVRNAYPGEHPWNVGIYMIENDIYNLECSGTIVTPFFVIADSACVIEEELDLYIVVAGSISKRFNGSREEHVQTGTIYKKNTFFAADVLVLKKRFDMTPFVRPVCYKKEKQLFVDVKEVTYEIPVWTEEDNVLKIIKYTTSVDAFRTVDDNTVNVTLNATVEALGGIFVSLKRGSDTRYFILGVGLVAGEDVPSEYIFLPSDIKFFNGLLNENNEKTVEKDECKVPSKPKHLKYIDVEYLPGDVVAGGTTIKYTCNNFTELYGVNELICNNTNWIQPSGIPRCIGCGMTKLKVIPNTFKSTKLRYTTKPDNFPWRACIYRKIARQQTCSGTIISSKLILTDTLCVKEKFNTNFSRNPIYSVTVGNYHWNMSLNQFMQHADVEELLFIGSYIKVAILVLQTHLTITEQVLPACIDLHKITNYSNPVVNSIIPYGTVQGRHSNKVRMNFLYFPKPLSVFWDNLFVYESKQLPCASNRFWIATKGTAVVFREETQFGPRYFVHSIFRYSDCSFKRLYFLSMRPFINWLNVVIENYR